MKLIYQSKNIERCSTDFRYAIKEMGLEKAKAFTKRLNELRSFDNLSDLMNSGLDNPHMENCNLKGWIGWSITGSYRLIIDPMKELTSNFLTIEVEIKEVKIRGIVDYHGSEKNNWIIK